MIAPENRPFGTFHASRRQLFTSSARPGSVNSTLSPYFLRRTDMTKRDQGKTSLVEFLRSIKFSRQDSAAGQDDRGTRFASFKPRARSAYQHSHEDSQLIRSGN
jgi:hypothetical protein